MFSCHNDSNFIQLYKLVTWTDLSGPYHMVFEYYYVYIKRWRKYGIHWPIITNGTLSLIFDGIKKLNKGEKHLKITCDNAGEQNKNNTTIWFYLY